MKAPREPLFLARVSYRRRRLLDAARVLPFLAIFLFLLPALWAGGTAQRTVTAAAYVFVAWLLLIAAAAFLGRRMPERDGGDDDER